MPKISKFSLKTSLYYRLIARCTQQFLNTHSNLLSIFGTELWFVSFSAQSTQKFVKYTLQNRIYSQKHSIYTLEVLKSSLYIQKSTQKHEKALDKCSLHLLFLMFTVLFYPICFNLIQSFSFQSHKINNL